MSNSLQSFYDELDKFADGIRQSATNEEWERFIHGARGYFDDEITEHDKNTSNEH